jgi:hypothetical protein
VDIRTESQMTNGPKHAPRQYSLVIAVMIASLVEGMLMSRLGTGYGLHLALIGSVTPIGIVLMTRRSPAAVTAIAVVIPKIWGAIVMAYTISALSAMQHRTPSLMWIGRPLLAALALAGLVWCASTWSATSSKDLRREPGRRMPTRPWIPAIGLVLLAVPFVARSMVSDRDVPIGVALAMIAWPLSSVLLGTWIPSVVTDAAFASVATRRHDRKPASPHLESMGDEPA